jgi:DNA-binding transcriptional regulator GbsR (MarR family)
MTPPEELRPVVRRFVQEAGNMTQSFGVGRVVGQVFAYLYFSQSPRNLANLQEALGISKGAASMGVRQLEQWGAVRRVWVHGDRKGYYEANEWLGKIVRSLVLDVIGSKIEGMETALSVDVPSSGDDQEDIFIKRRISELRAFHGRLRKAWTNPLLRRLLG